MTVQCALHMGALKIFESPWVGRPRLRNFKWAFVPIDPMNVRTKFEVRIALPVLEIIGGTQKWAVPAYAHAPKN